MNKILLIIQREYLTRVKKKSFIIMTILGPILMAALMVAPVVLDHFSESSNEQKVIAIVDDSKMYKTTFEDSEAYKFVFLDEPVDSIKNHLDDRNFYGVLHIPATKVMLPESAVMFSISQVPLDVKSYLKGIMKKHIEDIKLKASGIDKEVLATTKANINFSTIKITEDGKEKESFAEVAMGVGFVSAFIIYMFIFMFGSQVMRGVFEEKSNRIVEIIISSVKPFQLMMGKIIGIALVGLTQVLLWVVLTFGIYSAFTGFYSDTLAKRQHDEMTITTNQMQNTFGESDKTAETVKDMQENIGVNKVFDIINSINFGVIIGGFLFYFLGGYLLYSSLFAAIGSAVDNETDTQQFMLPITVPLIIAIIAAQVIIKNPEGPLAFWLSIIPFTSPIIMMIRIPFGVPYFDVLLSGTLLILGFIFTTWLAGRIYRTGILMYGKKITYKELWKWIKYQH